MDCIVSNVKLIMGADAPSDNVIAFYVKATIQQVKDFCNIDEIPEGLKFVIIEMCADKLALKNAKGGQGYGQGKQIVKSVSDGSQSVGFSDSSTNILTGMGQGTRDLLLGYEDQLISYRKMRW